MKQLLQSIDSKVTQVRDVPSPLCGPREILIANVASLISVGTEKSVVDLARKSLVAKAWQRPDEVRRVLRKCMEDGILETFRQVRSRLAEPLVLGYSSAGIVLETGREVARFRPGDRAASNGAHAEVVAVPHTLAARVPDGVAFEDACYAAVAAVGLQAVRLAGSGLGDRVAIIGLGLVGQLAAQLARAAGSRVIGTDPDAARREVAAEIGIEATAPEDFAAAVQQATEMHGADAVIIAASGDDSSALRLAAAAARKKARLVAIGDVGLDVPRRDFYAKELELVVSCSYGPGRYDREYEQKGQDYPYAYVRWTEQRNLEAVLEQIARGSLDVRRLTTHRLAIEEAAQAYDLIETDRHVGIVLTYSQAEAPPSTVRLHSRAGIRRDDVGVALVGSGRYAAGVLAPLLRRAPKVRARVVCSAGGLRAAAIGERHGFERATTSFAEMLGDPAVDVLFLATPHHIHAEQAVAALRAGKHVFIEKPLAVTADQLRAFCDEWFALDTSAMWTVGFNRRFSTAARLVADFFSDAREPLTLMYRVNAGPLPADHWVHDPEVGGGRLIGEACHALDLAAFLVNGHIVRVFADAPPPAGPGGCADREAAIVARFDNGSVGSIGYFAGGHKGFAKERIEVFGGGRVAVIEDFRRVTLSREGRTRQHRLLRRDKGHKQEVLAFLASARSGGPPPIPYAMLMNVSWAAIRVVDSLKTGIPADVPAF